MKAIAADEYERESETETGCRGPALAETTASSALSSLSLSLSLIHSVLWSLARLYPLARPSLAISPQPTKPNREVLGALAYRRIETQDDIYTAKKAV
ncbi:hypothetical protein NHX12_022125 [Muraenolepis orangiensis]|uniref:Uncharacterized protein n=1 Tax=Muraenolepis orangiensis TaxID=630683 RepID=A0A9Q0IUW1_9TELE|nr:hypothetical protein NHX12_022125 [Muraenolepis orangiensis]